MAASPTTLPAPLTRRATRDARAVALAAILVGTVVGVLTSFGQTVLTWPLYALANSVGGWLLAPFFVGILARTRAGAAWAGLVVCLMELASYTVTAELRGFAQAGTDFWAICAVVSGPLMGVGGRLWREATARSRGVGAALITGVFFAEGLFVYVHQLHERGAATLWLSIGSALWFGLTLRGGERRWLALTVPLGIVTLAALNHVRGV